MKNLIMQLFLCLSLSLVSLQVESCLFQWLSSDGVGDHDELGRRGVNGVDNRNRELLCRHVEAVLDVIACVRLHSETPKFCQKKK